MVIAVNTRFLLPEYLEGYGNFINECFSRLTNQFPQHTFIFIFDRKYNPDFIFSENVIPVVLPPETRHPFLWWIWFNIRVPVVLKKYKADVFVSTDGFCSLFTNVSQCLVIHDLAFLYYPLLIKKSHLLYYKKFTPLFLKKAKRVATVSEFSKIDIIKNYKINSEKIDVVFNGANELFKPVNFEEREAIKEQYAEGNEYFLCTAAIHPRKNLLNLLKAFSIFKKKQKSKMQLLIAGRFAWKNEEFKELLRTYKYRDEIKLIGYVDQAILVKITAGAYAMVYPSLFEGFGVPIIEAMRCKVPVLTSNVSAMPEIAGEAALYFNPHHYNEIADKMMLVFKDEQMRHQLIQKGIIQATKYNWDTTAALLWSCILKSVRS